MATIFDLPEDVLYILRSYLDVESVIRLSKTCVHFQQAYTNSSDRIARFTNCLGGSITFNDLALYLTNNNIHIVSLSINYVKVHKKRRLLYIIGEMETLKHLSLIETGIKIRDVVYIVNENKSITSLDVSSVDLCFPTFRSGIKNLKIYLNVLLQPKERYDTDSLQEVEHVEFIDTFYEFYGWYYDFINHSYNEIITYNMLNGTREPFMMQTILTQRTLENYNYVIQFNDGVMVSPLLTKEFECIPQKYIYNITLLETEEARNIKTIYICKKDCSAETFQRFKEIILEKVAEVNKYLVYQHVRFMCPFKNGDVIGEESNTDKYTHIEFHGCCFPITDSTSDHESSTFTSDEGHIKKSRTSKFCAIERLVEKYRNIQHVDITNRCSPCEQMILPSGFIKALPMFERLKSLSLVGIPNMEYEDLKYVFENCVSLRTFICAVKEQDFSIPMWLSKNIKLCMRIKTIILELHIFDVNTFLEPFADCKELQVLSVTTPSISISNKTTTKPFIFAFVTLSKLLEKCANLKFLSVVSKTRPHDLKDATFSDSKKIQDDLVKKFPFRHINLTKFKEYPKRCESVNNIFNQHNF